MRSALKDVVMTACRMLRPGPPRGLVLLYHSVGSPWGVRPEEFAWQLGVLLERFELVTCRELPDRLDHRAGRPLAALTFDDGYRDNAEVVAPLLADWGVHATFFVATGFLGGEIPNFAGRWPVMDRGQVRALAQAGHEVGAHTVSHQKLTRLGRDEAMLEVRDSKVQLEDLLGSPVVSFAYPKGDHDASVRSLVAETGFRVACTIEEGHLPTSPDWLALPRVAVLRSTTRRQFLAKMSRGLGLYERMRGR